MTGRARPYWAPERPPICAAIAAAREEAGWTQRELADKVGVAQSNLAGWEISSEPTLDMLVEIEAKLGLKRGQLLRDAGYVK